MNPLYSLLLGILQGLTEFIPVSSSGHLVLAQSLIPGFEQPGALFDVFLHAGTLFSIALYFGNRLFGLLRGYLTPILVGSLPAAFAGFLFQDKIEAFFVSTTLVGISLIATALMNYFTDRAKERKRGLAIKGSLLVGTFQALALIPGISRSGSTIFAASSLGVNKRQAAEFSFLLSIPAVAGANILQIFSHGVGSNIDWGFYSIGFLSAFASGYWAIKVMMNFLVSQKFKIFALYCFTVGLLTLLG